MTIKYNTDPAGNIKVITKDGKVSCECCGCPSATIVVLEISNAISCNDTEGCEDSLYGNGAFTLFKNTVTQSTSCVYSLDPNDPEPSFYVAYLFEFKIWVAFYSFFSSQDIPLNGFFFIQQSSEDLISPPGPVILENYYNSCDQEVEDFGFCLVGGEAKITFFP
jgi:hypothetical protein